VSADDIYFWWAVWLSIGTTIVVAAAALLIAVIIAARRILGLAKLALTVVGEIEQNTKPIWDLDTSHKVAEDLLVGAEAIRGNATAIVGALEAAGSKRVA
jgi:hypothetical protein